MELLIDYHDPIGLRNFGNTCYINSIIQCLRALSSHVNSVNRFFNNFNESMIESAELSEEIAKEYNFLISFNNILNNSNSTNLEVYLSQLFNFDNSIINVAKLVKFIIFIEYQSTRFRFHSE